MGTHNICLYKEVDKKYTGRNLKITESLDNVLIGICAVIRSNMVCCWFSLEVSHERVPQHLFPWKIKKNINTFWLKMYLNWSCDQIEWLHRLI